MVTVSCLASALSWADVNGVQIGLLAPVQIHPKDSDVDGFRLNLFYGDNHDVQGFDLGLVNGIEGSGHGFELGLVNHVVHNYDGFQAGILFNYTEDDFQGLQLGIVNRAGSLDGVQIGILNFNDDTKYRGFMPFINAAF